MSLYNHKEYLEIHRRNPAVKPDADKAAQAQFTPVTDVERINQSTDSTHAHDRVRFVRYDNAAMSHQARVAAYRRKRYSQPQDAPLPKT